MRGLSYKLGKLTMRTAQCASVIRSKNAGPFEVTIDVIFDNFALFEAARKSPLVDPSEIAKRLCVEVSRVLDVVIYEPAMAIKINLSRAVSSGTAGDRDVYGTQQFIPLLDIDIPLEDSTDETR